jgi:hypothetical protein
MLRGRRAEGQDLPVPLARLPQELKELVGRGAQVAY